MNRYSFKLEYLFSGMHNQGDWTDEKQNRLAEDLKKITVQTLGESLSDANLKATQLFRELIESKAGKEKSVRDEVCLELLAMEELP